MALVDTLRGITATEDDDYFSTPTLVYYINQALKQVISLATQREKYTRQSFRALDELRATQTETLTGFLAEDAYFTGTQSLPTDFLDWIYLKYNSTPLKELTISEQYLLKHGNAIPHSQEGYFTVANNVWKLFIHEDPDEVSDELIVEYVKTPTEIESVDVDFVELPDQLINSVINKAAVMLGAQEGRSDLKNYETIFQQELESNLY